jgi:hypothetical protein
MFTVTLTSPVPEELPASASAASVPFGRTFAIETKRHLRLRNGAISEDGNILVDAELGRRQGVLLPGHKWEWEGHQKIVTLTPEVEAILAATAKMLEEASLRVENPMHATHAQKIRDLLTKARES